MKQDNVCHSCLKECGESFCYSCRKQLFDGRRVGNILLFTLPEFTERKLRESRSLSISGYQLKHSLKLEKNKLKLIEQGGQYILKPEPHGLFLHLDQLPANEHLTMQIAKQVFGIDTAPNAFMLFADGKPAYLTRRFDIDSDGAKLVVEDFAQIAEKTAETHGHDYKYKYSYEEIGQLINKHIAASTLEIERFFRLVLFNYIISNGDAHLKNFSAYKNNEYGDYLLTPAYDLVCTRIHTPYESDMGLDLFADGYESEDYRAGSKHLASDFIEFGKRLGLKDSSVSAIISDYSNTSERVVELVEKSFLSRDIKNTYLALYKNKCGRFNT